MRIISASIIGFLLLTCSGCVERLITVTSQPAGASVWLNDEQVGTTPVTVPFTWYGHYEVTLRKDGYETVKTSRHAQTPVYQWPVIDLAAECLLPFHFVDRHEWDFDLRAHQPTDPDQLLERAQNLRGQTLATPD